MKTLTLPTTATPSEYETLLDGLNSATIQEFKSLLTVTPNGADTETEDSTLALPCGKVFSLRVFRDDSGDVENPLLHDELVKVTTPNTKYEIGNADTSCLIDEAEVYIADKLEGYDCESDYIPCPECRGEDTDNCQTCDADGEVENPLNFDDWDLTDRGEITKAFKHANYYLWCLKSDGEITETEYEEAKLDYSEVFPETLPVYLYDHSGITVSTSPFYCSWDSGRVGSAFVTWKGIEENFGLTRNVRVVVNSRCKTVYAVVETDLEGVDIPEGYETRTMAQIIDASIESLDDWVTGEVWAWVLNEDGLYADSCYGYVGDRDYCITVGLDQMRTAVEMYLSKCVDEDRVVKFMTAAEIVSAIQEADTDDEVATIVEGIRTCAIEVIDD